MASFEPTICESSQKVSFIFIQARSRIFLIDPIRINHIRLRAEIISHTQFKKVYFLSFRSNLYSTTNKKWVRWFIWTHFLGKWLPQANRCPCHLTCSTNTTGQWLNTHTVQATSMLMTHLWDDIYWWQLKSAVSVYNITLSPISSLSQSIGVQKQAAWLYCGTVYAIAG